MKRILFLSEPYYPVTTPNGVCLRAVSKQLMAEGYEVHIVCQGQRKKDADICHEGVYLHYIPPNLFLRMREYGEQHPHVWYGRLCYRSAMLLNKLQRILLFPWYPLNHPATLKAFYCKANNLHKELSFERVIGVYCPLEATLATIKFKKANTQIPVAIYVLDSLIYMPGASRLPKKVAEKLQWRLEKKVYEGADMVYNMRCHEIHHKKGKYDKYRRQMEFLDIPLFEPGKKNKNSERMFDPDRVQWIYMGTLFENYREPYYMCRLGLALSNDIPVQIQFYTRGSCEAKLSELCTNHPSLYVQHGYVSNDLKYNIYANADYLVNIGVNSTTMISSKVFDYMAYGKPIIQFYYQDDDVNNRYLKNYPLCCFIQMRDELFDENLEKLKNYMEMTKGYEVDSHYLLDTFWENTPNYTASRLKSFIKREDY